MSSKKTAISFLLFAFTVCSCSYLNKDNTEGVWFYTYTYGNTADVSGLTPASFLNLAPDHHFTLDFNKFEWGKWNVKGDTLILNASSKTIYFLLHHVTGSELRIDLSPGLSCDFEKQSYSYSADAAQPFSLQNNLWRKKATHDENKKEITQRLINHCEFWKTYFMWALDNEIKTIDVRSTPTPIKIYGNGFAIKTNEKLPLEWKNCFCDSANCQQANVLLENILSQHDIAWAHTDNKYKMFIGAFEQMILFLQQEQSKP